MGFDHIYLLYRIRWQIELFFKSAKSVLCLDQIPTGNEKYNVDFNCIKDMYAIYSFKSISTIAS